MLKNSWICFRTSFSCVGSNPSLQIHLFCEIQRKCHQACYSTNGLFSAVLMRNNLHVADHSYLTWNEFNEAAYKHSLPLSSHLLSMPCLEGKPNRQHVFAEIFIKQEFFWKILCLHSFMLPECGL